MRIFDVLARLAFAVAGGMLMLMAIALIFVAGYQVTKGDWPPTPATGSVLLEAVGYTIIAIAVFDVGKYLIQEESIRAREMRQAGEARRSMTKFLTTIAIAVFLESLVAVFEASKSDVSMMLYPTLLMFAGVSLIIALGLYQRLSTSAEETIVALPDSAEDGAKTSAASKKN